jgi:2-C-methyl-D-erythritol 4-phosphate cytidylyltransferase
MRTVAVVLAGGSGERFGGGVPKQLLPLRGRTLLEHSVAAFERAPCVDGILVVIAAAYTERAAGLLAAAGFGKVTKVIAGGATRVDSTRAAIAELSSAGSGAPGSGAPGSGAPGLGSADCDVLFHDAARPLVDQQTIAGCAAALADYRAVGVCVPCSDTVAVVSDGLMTGMPRRDSLVRCQTPQGFRLSVIRRAHELAAADPAFADLPATDDCGIVLRYLPDVEVRVVPGSERNIKITYPRDLDIAETLLKE